LSAARNRGNGRAGERAATATERTLLMAPNAMHYTLLGRSGLRVSPLCLGTMGFLADGKWAQTPGQKWGSSRETSREIVTAFLDAGGNLIDTANTYGAAEGWLGEFMGSARHQYVISTKYGGSDQPVDVNASGNHRKSMIQAVEASLRRLKTDYIDILSVQCWDFLTPYGEIMRAMDDLVSAGKVLYIGVANTPAWVIAQANTDALHRGLSQFAAVQVEYNLLERDVEREILPMARALEMTVMAWTPLASGWLTAKYLDDDDGVAAGKSNGGNGGGPVPQPRRLDNPLMKRFVKRDERSIKIADEVRRIARDVGRPPAQVALNWLRQSNVIPIFGARTVEQVRENMACIEFELTSEQLQQLSQVGKIPLGYPHALLNNKMVRNLIYGDKTIKNPRQAHLA
jgi:aryl-alcohol dehydrogenase-like predicted oxidoreductase